MVKELWYTRKRPEKGKAVKWKVADTPFNVVIQCEGFFHGASLYLDYRRKELFKMAKEKIRIRLKSYDHRLLDQSAKKIIDSVKKEQVLVV